MKFLPIRKSFFLVDATVDINYLTWFRVTGKPYLLCQRRGVGKFNRKGNDNRHSSSLGGDAVARWGTDIPRIFHLYTDIDANPNVGACTATNNNTDTYPHAVVDTNFDARDNIDVLEIWGTLWLHADSDTNIAHIIVLSRWLNDVTIGRGSEGYKMGG
ncbi:hypothetical protein PVK06_020302 [Gossypium arboreum]|uniref:Uncharacterized protein n=1 Tax=Gossypium arboreum TaxID=29729 RepID=A0ABR0PMP1_GOSAR|nr:hypothetical protein PVK06_020302 [Gossypium arboreum]